MFFLPKDSPGCMKRKPQIHERGKRTVKNPLYSESSSEAGDFLHYKLIFFFRKHYIQDDRSDGCDYNR